MVFMLNQLFDMLKHEVSLSSLSDILCYIDKSLFHFDKALFHVESLKDKDGSAKLVAIDCLIELLQKYRANQVIENSKPQYKE